MIVKHRHNASYIFYTKLYIIIYQVIPGWCTALYGNKLTESHGHCIAAVLLQSSQFHVFWPQPPLDGVALATDCERVNGNFLGSGAGADSAQKMWQIPSSFPGDPDWWKNGRHPRRAPDCVYETLRHDGSTLKYACINRGDQSFFFNFGSS